MENVYTRVEEETRRCHLPSTSTAADPEPPSQVATNGGLIDGWIHTHTHTHTHHRRDSLPRLCAYDPFV